MAKDKKSFILYADQKGVFEQLPDELAGQLIKHILRYVNDENPVSDNLIINIAFEPIKSQLKRDLKEWEQTKETKSISGRSGNLKRYNPDLYIRYLNGEDLEELELIAKTRKASQSDNVPSQEVANLAVNVNDTVTVNVNDKKKYNFSQALLSYGFNSDLVTAWLQVRRKKKAVDSEIAFRNFVSEVEKTGKDKNYILEQCVYRSWSGFKAGWIDEQKKKSIDDQRLPNRLVL